MPPKPIDYYKRPFYKASLEKQEIQVSGRGPALSSCLCLAAAHALRAVVQEDIALIENLAGIKRRTQAPARYGNAYEKEYTGRGGRGYENDS